MVTWILYIQLLQGVQFYNSILCAINQQYTIYFETQMEDTDMRPLLKKQKSHVLLTSQHKTNYTSKAIREFEDGADRYKQYLGGLHNKIDKICEKEQYRNYLKEQKLNSVKHQLEERKSQLEKVLEDKRDPIKSPNGKIYCEILELQKLEASYNEILAKLQDSVREKKREIEELNQKVKEQKIVIKKTLRQSFCESLSNSILSLSNVTRQSPKKQSTYSRDSGSYKSKSRQSMLSRLGSSWQQKTKEAINEQEEKMIMLRLFCVYARSQKPGAHPIPTSTIELVERELKVKNELLLQVKQMLNKQDKRSLHCD